MWIIFVCLKYIGLDLDLRKSFKKKLLTNIGELQHMKYICDEIILVMEYEKLHKYFKTRVVGGMFCEFDGGHYYSYTPIEFKAIWKLKNFGC